MSVRFDAPSQHLGRPVHERGTVVVVSNLILTNSRLHSRVRGALVSCQKSPRPEGRRAQDRSIGTMARLHSVTDNRREVAELLVHAVSEISPRSASPPVHQQWLCPRGGGGGVSRARSCLEPCHGPAVAQLGHHARDARHASKRRHRVGPQLGQIGACGTASNGQGPIRRRGCLGSV